MFAFPIFSLPDLDWTPLGSLLALSLVPLAPLGLPCATQGFPWEASRDSMGGPWGPRNLSWIPLGAILKAVLFRRAPTEPSWPVAELPGTNLVHLEASISPFWSP